MPWDSDIDVQMSASTVHFLASYYNMTVHTYMQREYMLEINPKYTNSSFKDKLNVIDGRWIDIQNGLFIDITAIRPKDGSEGIVASKDKHEEKVRFFACLEITTCSGSVLTFKLRYTTCSLCAKALSRDFQSKSQTIMQNF